MNPIRGVERRHAQYKLNLMKRHFEGASTGDRFKDWTPISHNRNGLDPHSLDLMANRISYLYDNSAPVKRGINAIANYTFGAGCVPHAVKPDGKKHDRLEGILKDYCDTPACDLEERETLYSKQLQAGIHVPRDGAFLLQRIWTKDPNSPLPFKIKCLTQDHIDKSKNQIGNYGARIVQGIEYNSQGQRTAIWINDYLPNQRAMAEVRSRRIKMKDLCHPFRTTVAGQTHGITWGAPIIVKAKDFDDYMDAQLVRQKIAACFVAIVHDIEGGGDSKEVLEGKMSPGTLITAPEGKIVEFSNPPQLEGIGEYVKIQHHGIASGLEVPYMIVSSDFSDSNYTQSRMTILDFARQIETYQQHIFHPQMNYRIGQWILEACQLKGYGIHGSKILWVYPRKEYVDPVKDIQAFILAVQNGFMSWEMGVREMGYDPQDVIKSIQNSENSFKGVGMMMPSFSSQIKESMENET
jgi:lambda family phage portal protein